MSNVVCHTTWRRVLGDVTALYVRVINFRIIIIIIIIIIYTKL